MIIVGCDYHPSFQQIAFVDTDTGELGECRLEHREAAEKFYREFAAQGAKSVCSCDTTRSSSSSPWT
jgi:transposase